MKLPLTQNPAVLLLWHNDQTYGCAASPETNYQPLDESSLGRPYMFMHWTFNRGVSVITVGGEFNATSGQLDLNSDAPAPVTWTRCVQRQQRILHRIVDARRCRVAAVASFHDRSVHSTIRASTQTKTNSERRPPRCCGLPRTTTTPRKEAQHLTPTWTCTSFCGDLSRGPCTNGMNTTTGQVTYSNQVASLGGDGIADMLYFPNMDVVLS